MPTIGCITIQRANARCVVGKRGARQRQTEAERVPSGFFIEFFHMPRNLRRETETEGKKTKKAKREPGRQRDDRKGGAGRERDPDKRKANKKNFINTQFYTGAREMPL